jgi:hypothetical protein
MTSPWSLSGLPVKGTHGYVADGVNYNEAMRVLGLAAGASEDAIDDAFARKAKQLHPDQGGEHESMVELSDAREAARRGPSSDLAPRQVLDLVLSQTQAMERRERRRDARERSGEVVRALIRHERRELTARKQKAQVAAGGAAIVAATAGVVRAIGSADLPVASQTVITLTLVLFAVVAATFACLAAMLKWRADRLEERIEDAAEVLSERPAYLSVIEEIERVSGHSSPWTPRALRSAIANWTDSQEAERGTIAALARSAGPREFMRLLVAKGAELDLLVEDVRAREDGRRVVEYRLRLPE